MMEKVLQKIGLSENESNVYLSLLPLEKSGVSVLANKTKLHRNVVRKICTHLKELGIIRERKIKNTFYYYPNSPESLQQVIFSKENKLQQCKQEIEQNMSALKTLHNPNFAIPKVQYYEGIEGMKMVYEDILLQGKNVYCWTNFAQKVSLFDPDYIQKYLKRRIAKGITIFSIEPKDQDSLNVFDLFHQLNCQSILIENLPIQNGEIRIYGNKIAFISFQNSQNIKSYILDNNHMATMLRGIFTAFTHIVKPK